MPFDPDHTVEGKIQKDKDDMWKRLTYDPDLIYQNADKAMRKMIKEMYKELEK